MKSHKIAKLNYKSIPNCVDLQILNKIFNFHSFAFVFFDFLWFDNHFTFPDGNLIKLSVLYVRFVVNRVCCFVNYANLVSLGFPTNAGGLVPQKKFVQILFVCHQKIKKNLKLNNTKLHIAPMRVSQCTTPLMCVVVQLQA